MKNLYFFLFFILGFMANAQEKVILNGKIHADSIAYREVNIVNLNSKIGVINTSDGNFKIKVQQGDTLFFSSLQYEPQEVKVTKAMVDKLHVEVYLIPLINELEEVNISNIALSGFLEKDVSTIKTNDYFNPLEHGLPVNNKPKPTTAQRRLYTATHSGSGVPLDPFLNMLSGRMAMLKRLRVYEKQEEWVQKGLNVLPASFFQTELGLAPDSAEDFLYYCIRFKRFKRLVVKEENTLELIDFYKEKIKTYNDWKK